MIRPLDEQFGSEVATRIRTLLDRLSRIAFPDGATEYYAHEARTVLEAGALLAALATVASLLEMAIRSLVVAHSRDAARSGLDLQELLELRRELGFGTLVDSLTDAGLFEPKDVAPAKAFYRQVRIPVHHGLPARFVRDHADGIADFRALLRDGEPIGLHDLEEVVEVNALSHIETALDILERNCGARGS